MEEKKIDDNQINTQTIESLIYIIRETLSAEGIEKLVLELLGAGAEQKLEKIRESKTFLEDLSKTTSTFTTIIKTKKNQKIKSIEISKSSCNEEISFLHKYMHLFPCLEEIRSRSMCYYGKDTVKMLFDFPKLIRLEISNANFKDLSECFGNLSSLEELILFNNGIIFLPDSFENLKNLKELNLSYNNIETLPNLETLHNLKRLNLSNNNIRKLPDYFLKLPNLKYLNLSGNDIKNSPNFFIEMEKNGLKVIRN